MRSSCARSSSMRVRSVSRSSPSRLLAAHALRLADDVVQLLLVLRDEARRDRARLSSSRPGSLVRDTMNSRMMAPKPQQIASRNDMLKTSNWRRRFMASPRPAPSSSRPTSRYQSQYAGAASGSPSMASRITLIGTPLGRLPHRTIEVVQPLLGADAFTRRQHVAHRRQAVDEQIDVVGLRLELLQRVERGMQARRALRDGSRAAPRARRARCRR